MIRSAIVVAVVALVFSATTAWLSHSTVGSAQQESVSLSLDLNTGGNTGNAIGSIDACRSASAGDTFDIDLVAQGVPPVDSAGTSGGLSGFQYNLHYNPAVINITAADNSVMLGGASSFEEIYANYTPDGGVNPFPSTNGNVGVVYLDLTGDYASGEGVLTRFTVKIIGSGRSDLSVDGEQTHTPAPFMTQKNHTDLNVTSIQNAAVSVGQACTSPPTPFAPATATPTPPPITPPVITDVTQGPSGSSTPAPSVVPAGSTKLAIDTITTGNEATKVGQIDECASADPGETFQVDVVITGVTDLLAWELPVSFDKSILRVDDSNVKLFQAANTGSQVYDTSNQTPNDTGVYIASAFDAADPPSPDSGDGTLVRLTLTAIGTGTSNLALSPVDLDANGHPDRGVLLRTVSNAIIGGTAGDSFFDGPATAGEIRVGSDCPSGGKVVQTSTSNTPSSESSSSNTWVWVVAGAAALAIVLAGGGVAVVASRRRRRQPPPS